jgi:hypothetical protein
LKIVASLNVTNEFGNASVKVAAGNVQAAVGQRSTKVRANIKS